MKAGTRRRWLSVLAGASALAMLASCGVREDDTPRALAAEDLPADLVDPSPASTVPAPSAVPRQIYLVESRTGGEDQLVRYLVPIDPTGDADTYAKRVIETLVSQPLGENEPFTTAIPPTTDVLDARMVQGPDGEQDVLEINLNQLDVSGGARLKLAIAQMVFTATAIPGVRGVRFLKNGSPVAVPLDSGESESGAVVTRSDFPQLNPTSTSTTTSTTAAPAPAVAEPAATSAGD